MRWNSSRSFVQIVFFVSVMLVGCIEKGTISTPNGLVTSPISTISSVEATDTKVVLDTAIPASSETQEEMEDTANCSKYQQPISPGVTILTWENDRFYYSTGRGPGKVTDYMLSPYTGESVRIPEGYFDAGKRIRQVEAEFDVELESVWAVAPGLQKIAYTVEETISSQSTQALPEEGVEQALPPLQTRVYIKEPYGSSLVAGSIEGRIDEIMWAPNGETILLVAAFPSDQRLPNPYLWKIDVATGSLQPILQQTYYDTGIEVFGFTPDSQWFIVGTYAGVVAINIDTNQVMELGFLNEFDSIFPISDQFVLAVETDNNNDLNRYFVVEWKEGTKHLVYEAGPSVSSTIQNPISLSSDRQTLAYIDHNEELWLLQICINLQ